MAPMTAGYWGKVTSTLDWCENNYETSYYIAEFWNTISNIFMIIPPAFSFVRSFKTGNDTRLLLCYALLTIVGFGSWLFHMTLKYEMQLLDELPMIWGSLYLVFILGTIAYPTLEQSLLLKVLLFAYGVMSTFIYLILQFPLLFQVSYGILVSIVLYLDIYVARFKECTAKLFYYSAFLYYLGFFIWNIDNIFCEQLENIRQAIPPILIPFTQGHAIWHCFAGYGSYLHIYFCAEARAKLLKQKTSLEWDLIGIRIVYNNGHKHKQ